MNYLGDFAEDSIIDFKWGTNGRNGGSITRATDGTISVYKANGTTQSVAGITDTEDFDSLVGVHHCRVDSSADAFYAIANDYQVVLSAATIDGQVVNAVIAEFSIENRFAETSLNAQGKLDVNAECDTAISDASLSTYAPATDTVEGTLTYKQAEMLELAMLVNKSSGGGTATITFRDLADTKNRITMTVTSVGDRTAVTLDAT